MCTPSPIAWGVLVPGKLAGGGGERGLRRISRMPSVGEHQMRPLFGFFSRVGTIPTYVYASDRDFRDGSLQNLAVLRRAEQVAGRNGRIPDSAGVASTTESKAAASGHAAGLVSSRVGRLRKRVRCDGIA